MLNLGYVSNNLGFGGGQKTGHKPSLALLAFAGGEQTVDIDWNPELAKNDGIWK